MKIILTRGLPAAGKSVWAKKTVQDNPGKYKNVCKDDLRAMLDEGAWSKKNEGFLLEIRDSVVIRALADGYNVIISDTNFEKRHEERMKEIATNFKDVDVEIKFFDTPLDECIARDAESPNPVGEEVIRGMYDRYLKVTPEPYPVDPSLPDIAIIDIDGTLAKMVPGGRSPFDWHRVGEDMPNQPVIELARMISQKYRIVVFSGRDEVCRKETEVWLDKHMVPTGALLMRPEGDMRKDSIVKREIFERDIRGKYNVMWVIDDRKKVVQMWRSLGLTCLQCAEGDF